MSAQDLVATYVDLIREAGGRRDDRQVARVSKQCRALLEEGVEEDVVAEAIGRMISKGISEPWRLGGFVNDVLLARAGHHDELAEFMAAHEGKWPTGCRFVRGTHSGSYKYDPLSYEETPYWWDYGRPTRQEVVAALRERKGTMSATPDTGGER